MTTTKPRGRRLNRERAIEEWARQSPARAAAARDEKRIEDHEHHLTYGHLDEDHHQAVQDRYERSIGWGVD